MAYVLTLAIFARAILSWFPIDPRNPVVSFLHEITEPILAPLRQVLPRIGFLDLSPLVAIILLQVVARLAADALTG
ncbi:hypothetical protein HRbin24_00524 [bacterium HR24]|nr:hypothetical protein HRbin24_00524 [bacterium HR24]